MEADGKLQRELRSVIKEGMDHLAQLRKCLAFNEQQLAEPQNAAKREFLESTIAAQKAAILAIERQQNGETSE